MRTVPGTPAPGRLEEGLGLVLAHAFPLRSGQQGAVLCYLLEPGLDSVALKAAAARYGMSTRRVRQLVDTARTFAASVRPASPSRR